MSAPPTIPQLPNYENPPIGCYFMVVFFIGGILPNPLDIRFQTVSGLEANIETEEITEGGENLYKHKLPKRVNYSSLSLTRGMVIGSPLNIEFNVAMSFMHFSPSNVLVILLNPDSVPLASWLFEGAYPTSWKVSNLDANQNQIVIDTMELTFARFQSLRV